MDTNDGFYLTYNAWIGMIDTHVNLVGKHTIKTYYSEQPANAFILNNDLYLACYLRTYTNPYKCDTTNWTAIIVNLGYAPLGIEEQGKEKTVLFELSPNPARDEAVVRLKTPYENEVYTLSIKNMKGEEIHQEKIKGYKLLQTSYWPPGQYLITLRNEKGISETKILSKE